MKTIVIAGASLAGMRAAEALREAGFDGTIRLVGDEAHRPYERPPLSKQVLAGTWDPGRVDLAVPEDVASLDLSWDLGRELVGLDRASSTVALDDGETIAYDGLIITTGASPRTLPASEGVAGCHVVRTVDDCLALRKELEAMPSRVVVVGAGFIGSEVAATCRGRGLDVTVVEPLPAPLARAMPTAIGEVLADLHRDHGVDLRLGVGVEQLLTAPVDGSLRATGVALSDGSSIDADVVVVGIGVVPNTGWLQGSGLILDDGVVCDATCLAAPRIVAAGDVARWPNLRFGEVMRVEHWENAQSQGEHAARRLLAGDDPGEPYQPVPWFWSDQYDRKIQLAGRTSVTDQLVVVDGSLEERRFVALLGRGGKVVGALGMNRPAPVMQWSNRIAEGASWDEVLAAAQS